MTDPLRDLRPIVWLPGTEVLQEEYLRIDAEIDKEMTPPWWIGRLDPSEQQAWWYERWQATGRLREMRQHILLSATTHNYRLPIPGGSLIENGIAPEETYDPPRPHPNNGWEPGKAPFWKDRT